MLDHMIKCNTNSGHGGHCWRFREIFVWIAISAWTSAAIAAAPADATPPAANQPATSQPAAASSATTSSSLAETSIHLYYLVGGYSDLIDTANDGKTYCSAPRAELRVGADNGTALTVAVDNESKNEEETTGVCAGKYVEKGHQYTINKSAVLNASPTIQGVVSGVLAVPFKYHLSDHAVTAGSTIGGYVGYRTSVANAFSVTPVVAGGLALISTATATIPASSSTTTTTQSTQTTSTQTSAGASIATGFIGSVTSAASKGAQFGVLVGVDWLGKKANYAYEGKPWIAFEIGYNFAL